MGLKNLLLIVLFNSSLIIYSQTIQNAEFNADCNIEESLPCFWNISWGGEDCCALKNDGKNYYLSLVSATENGVKFVEQTILIEETNEIKIINLSGSIRSKEILGKGASLHIQLYNSNGDYIAKKDMGGSQSATWISGNKDWKNYSIRLICPKGISKINVGAILQGEGIADFDNFEMSIQDIKVGKSSPVAEAYLTEVADLIGKHSLYRDSINVEAIRKKAITLVGAVESTTDCHIGIDYFLAALQQFGDHHSFFMTAKEAVNWKEGGDNDNPAIKYPYVKKIGSIGYVYMPGFHSINNELIIAYADSLQQGLRETYDEHLKGWIVDLRPNDGGNMEPMVMGLGPLLDEGYLGSLVDVNGIPDRWQYENGSVFWGNEKGESLENHLTLSKKLPIAVLTGSTTGSSGEIAAISFIGNTSTMSFGQTTMGLTTGNGNFDLSDGSVLFISSTQMADREGNTFVNGVIPDNIIENSKNIDDDLVLEAAKAWILNLK